jgi:D-aminoacyl-tRNA deacylase
VISLIQRVSQARVVVNQQTIATIEQGICALIGVEKHDTPATADRLLERMLGYRIFADADGRMNLSLTEIQGGLLLVPQFTLPADTSKGMRPGFSPAAPPDLGHQMFDYLLQQARFKYKTVGAGQFGADMQVHLVNDGPVTFWLQT